MNSWYVRLVVGGTAWLAALMALIAFYELRLGSSLNFAAGLLCCGLAGFLKRRPGGTFLEQFGLALFLLGQALAVTSLGDLRGPEVAALLLQALLISLYADPAGRFLTGLWAGYTLADMCGPELRLIPMLGLALLTAWLWGPGRERWRPLALAAVCDLFGLLYSATVYDGLALTLLVAGVLVQRRAGVRAVVAALLLGGVTCSAPGILAAAAALALGCEAGSLPLQGLATLFLLGFGSQFYYNLDMTLLEKSQLLLCAGFVLLFSRRVLLRTGTSTRLGPAPVAPPSGFSGLAWAGLVLALAVPAGLVWHKEQLLRHGETVYLRLAPVDPRSLMQGDYMRLDYEVARHGDDWPEDGCLIVRRDEDGVGRLVGLDQGKPLAPGEVRLRFRRRGWRTSLGADSFFFQEGQAARYSRARFAELKVSPGGECLVRSLLDEQRRPIGQSSSRATPSA